VLTANFFAYIAQFFTPRELMRLRNTDERPAAKISAQWPIAYVKKQHAPIKTFFSDDAYPRITASTGVAHGDETAPSITQAEMPRQSTPVNMHRSMERERH